MNRRRFLAGVAAGCVIAGFDPTARRWIRMAEASPDDGVEPIPHLDGALFTDDADLTADTTDNGNIVRHRPWAILRPGSVDDVVAMVLYCNRHNIRIGPRGQAHTVHGQSLVDGGLVIETGTLNTIHSITDDRADVDAGVLWKDLLAATVAVGLTPPVLTGYLGLSVGGTLSVGGVSATSQDGVQVDHVKALQVVTGTGQLVWCSDFVQPDLFHGALGGLGQLAIIVRAVLELVPAPARARSYVLQYTDPQAFFRDLEMMLARGEFDGVYGSVVSVGTPQMLPQPPASVIQALGPLAPALNLVTNVVSPVLGLLSSVISLAPGTWVYQLNLIKYYNTGSTPDGSHLLRGTSDILLLRQQMDQGYSEFALRVDALVDFLTDIGLWRGVPHPWFDMLLPGEVTQSFVTNTVSGMHFDDVGLGGLVLLFPIRRAALTRPFFNQPSGSSEWIYLFDILTAAPGPGPNTDFVTAKLNRNRTLYEQSRSLGGKIYPIGAVPMDQTDWANQYGASYATFAQLKTVNDPNAILTPGPGIFG